MEKFLTTYNTLNATNLHLLESIYTDDIIFTDPTHTIQGLAKLSIYFKALYSNLNSIKFEFRNPLKVHDKGYVQWNMTFSHPRLIKGAEIEVPGISFLKFHPSGKVYYHQDQFDLGCLLYEHLPIIGYVISTIKKRLVA